MKLFRDKINQRAGGFIPRNAGFTLVETLVAMTIGGAAVAGMLSVFVWFNRSYRDATLLRNTSARASLALERMVYGVGTNFGLRAATASTITLTSSNGWCIIYNTNLFFRYVANAQVITNQSGKVVCTNVVASTVTLTSTTNGCDVSVTVAESNGGRATTNTMSSFVEFRN